MSSTFCFQCNTSNRAQSKFCSNCGRSLTSSGQAHSFRLRAGQVMRAQYTIRRQLGKGGMGVVYLASETIANKQRYVVIKEMLDYYDPHDPQAEAKARQRFEQEAATLATLNFASIPQIFTYFSHNGRNYIVMQYIEGRNLEAGVTHEDDNGNLVPGQPYPVDKVRRWGVQICQVLENLATKNMVHMDIKPANLIEDNSGHVWLVDFGTAKAQRVLQSGGRVGMQKSSVYGTAGYAPPEQYNGNVEPRSDVYALAATIYHLLTDDDPRNHPFAFPQLDKISSELKSALEQALEQDVKKRITAPAFRKLLEVRPATGPVFRWQDGTVSYQPKELVQSAEQHWDEARRYFTRGDWEKWFKTLHHNQALVQMQQAKKQHQNSDVALDAFLRALDPSLPPARLQTNTPTLNFGAIPWREKQTQAIQLRNVGQGFLHGEFTKLPSWLRVDPPEFATRKQQTIKVTVDTHKLTPRVSPYTTNLLINTGANHKVRLPVTVTVPEPKLLITPQALNLGLSSQDTTVEGTFTIHNSGGSPFEGKIRHNSTWVTISSSGVFRCKPSESVQAKIKVDTGKMKLGQHSTSLHIQAQADKWQQTEELPVYLNLPVLRTYWTRHRGRILSMLFVLTIILSVATFFINREIKGRTCYNEANALLQAKEWAQAATRFELCGTYRDAPDMVREVHYQAGLASLAAKQWQEALKEFEQAGTHKDAPNMINEVHYQAGRAYLTKDQWQEAIQEFEQAGPYKDAPNMINEAHYQAGRTYLKEEKWQEAIKEFEQAGTYKDASDMINEVHYQAGEAHLAAGNAQEAAKEFEQAGTYKDAAQKAEEIHYEAGLTYLEAQQWDEAASEFEQAGSYEDAPTMVKEVHYQAGLAYLAEDEWQKAAEEFEKAGPYQDAPEMALEIRYQAGRTYLTEQQWDEAATQFEKVGAYRDAPEQLVDTHLQAYQVYLAAEQIEAATKEYQWIITQWRLAYILEKYTTTIWSVAFSPDESVLLSGSGDDGYAMGIWDTINGELLHTVAQNTGDVNSVAFSPDQTLAASGERSCNETLLTRCIGGHIRLWYITNGRFRSSTLAGHSSDVKSVAFAPDSTLLASGSSDNTVKLWNLATENLDHTLEGHTETVSSVTFSPDGRLLASGSLDDSIRLWRVANKELVSTLHTNDVTSVAFSPDGTWLASASDDKTVRLWRVDDGSLVRTLEGHTNSVKSVAFSPNGMILASGSWDETIRLWNVVSGELVHTLQGDIGSVNSVAFSPDGLGLASGSDDGNVRLWYLNSGEGTFQP